MMQRDLESSAALTDLPSPQIAEVSDDEAVRIFLEFERVESAIKGQWPPPTTGFCRRHTRPIFPCEEVDVTASVSPNCCITALII